MDKKVIHSQKILLTKIELICHVNLKKKENDHVGMKIHSKQGTHK